MHRPRTFSLFFLPHTEGMRVAQKSPSNFEGVDGEAGRGSLYLMNGSKDDKAVAALNDNELLQQFKEVDLMNKDDKDTVKKLIDAFITKAKIKQLVL